MLNIKKMALLGATKGAKVLVLLYGVLIILLHMQIYGMVSKCSRRWAASPIWYKNFEQKGLAYMPVFTVK